jgi:tetratricopeptide (TPR) repeat protein
MDWLQLLQEQQRDFLDRLQSHHLLHSNKAGRHSEVVTISGDKLEQIKSLCRHLISRYQLDRVNRDYSFIFQQLLAQKLAEKVIAFRLANLIDLVNFKKEYSQKLTSNITLSINTQLNLKVKVIDYKQKTLPNNLKYFIEPQEIEADRIFIFAIVPRVDTFSTKGIEVIIAGFFPCNLLKNTDKFQHKIEFANLLYSGGILSYLTQVNQSNSDYLQLAQTCLDVDDYTGTIENLNLALESDTRQDLAYKTMGYTKYLMGDKSGSIVEYNKAIKINPYYTEAYLNRADSYYQLEDYQNAATDYTEVIRLSSQNGSFYIWRGDALCRLGEYSKAILDYNEAIRINPSDYICYVWRADACFQIEDYQRAEADYSMAITLNERKDDDYLSIYLLDSIYFNRGNARYYLGNYLQAIKDYSRAIEINPSYAEAYLKRAITYYKLGDYQAGVADYNRAVEINPELTI